MGFMMGISFISLEGRVFGVINVFLFIP